MSKLKLATAVAVFAFSALGSSALAEFKQFDEPQYKHLALDWCKSYTKDCGKPAADAYCVSQGYGSASKYSKAEDVEYPTRVISDNHICDEAGCDSFASIVCEKADPVEENTDDYADGGNDYSEGGYEAVTYDYPRAGKWHLDWCLSYQQNCGKPAADYYCKSKGHEGSSAFEIDSDFGKTRVMKTGEKCTDQSCDGFKYITCK